MPPDLVAAHLAVNKAVDVAYGQRGGFTTEALRLAYLFSLFQARRAPLDVPRVKVVKKGRKKRG